MIVTSGAGQPDFVRTRSFQCFSSASASSAGNHWAAWESPNRTTDVPGGRVAERSTRVRCGRAREAGSRRSRCSGCLLGPWRAWGSSGRWATPLPARSVRRRRRLPARPWGRALRERGRCPRHRPRPRRCRWRGRRRPAAARARPRANGGAEREHEPEAQRPGRARDERGQMVQRALDVAIGEHRRHEREQREGEADRHRQLAPHRRRQDEERPVPQVPGVGQPAEPAHRSQRQQRRRHPAPPPEAPAAITAAVPSTGQSAAVPG